jgi:hypothetical protein
MARGTRRNPGVGAKKNPRAIAAARVSIGVTITFNAPCCPRDTQHALRKSTRQLGEYHSPEQKSYAG